MQKNSPDFSIEDVQRLARTPAGQQLIALLQGADNAQLQNAVNQAAAGNIDSAKQALGPLLSSPQVQALLKQLGG